MKPNPGEVRHAESIPPPLAQFETIQTSPSFAEDGGASNLATASSSAIRNDVDTVSGVTKTEEDTKLLTNDDSTKGTGSNSEDSASNTASECQPDIDNLSKGQESTEESTQVSIEIFDEQSESLAESSTNSSTILIENIPSNTKKDVENDDDDDAFEDADSQEATGLEDAEVDRAENPIGDDDENDDHTDKIEMHEVEQKTETSVESAEDDSQHPQHQTQNSTAGKVGIILQRLLNLSGQSAGQVLQSGQVVLQMGGARNSTPGSSNAIETKPGNENSDTTNSGAVAVTAPSSTTTSPPSVGTPSLCSSTNPPSIVRNGQMICNLQDHSIHAGATAIVAVISGKTLTVANAGDSRAVLCRGGEKTTTIALSVDHKPMQERELTRIRNAGGFVNSFGRVNGNLNLSRSIGDLKYKQVANIPPEKQIITAHPDIKQ